jgi:putative hydrolase of the HAD superfamily
MDIDYIFFDCMETLVDLHKLPAPRDYALWAYSGSGAEELWEDFDEFFRYYWLSKKELAAKLPEHAEYEMRDRFLYLIRQSLPDLPDAVTEKTADKLYANYWRNYKAGCYVRDDVRRALDQLSGRYKMGVVSNFMVMDGIEELLKMTGIDHYFSFVVTSVSAGWRKPHPEIYNKALRLSGAKPERILFVGDDYINDYTFPVGIGMKAAFLDRSGRRPDLPDRISDFDQLAALFYG